MIEFELFLEELEKNAGLSDAYRYEGWVTGVADDDVFEKVGVGAHFYLFCV